MTTLPATALWAGLCALLYLVLSIRVVAMRNARQLSLGDGGDPAMVRRVRAHGNAAEYLPLGLILLGLSEGMGAPAWLVHAFGAAFLAGRVLHALHFARVLPGMIWRVTGMALTLAVIGSLGFGLIGHALFGRAMPAG